MTRGKLEEGKAAAPSPQQLVSFRSRRTIQAPAMDSTTCHLRIPPFVLLVTLVFSHLPSSSDAAGQETVDREYCWQSFNATCSANEVILMQRAVYGRMKLGRCLTRDYYVGCSADVLHYADRRCSGRPHCDFPIPDTSLQQLQPCPKDLMAYLEASYQCVEVANQDTKRCHGDINERHLKAPGYLASVTTSEKVAAATNPCPWRITVLPGQRINVTLYDFNLVGRPSDRSDSSTVCQVYAMMTEKASSTDVTVCGGEQRERMVYLSETNSIDIQVVTITDEEQHGHFLLKYEAVGCADMEPPKGGWIKRRGDRLTIACNGTGETRHLVCSGTRWIGEVRNCSQGNSAAIAELISNDNDFPFGLVIAIVIGVLLGVILGVLLLATVTCCQRRIHRNHTGRNNIFLTSASKSGNIRRQAVEKAPGTVVRTSDYGYAHVWELQHLRGSPDCQPDVTKENPGEKTNSGEQRIHYDQRTGTITTCRGAKEYMYESPHHQAPTTGADIVVSHDGIPYYHEFDPDIQELTTYPAGQACMADTPHHECIHMALSDKKL